MAIDLERAIKAIADREVFAQDGAIYAYDAETCFRVGSAENAAESDVSASIGTVIAAAPLLISEIASLRASLRAALARHKTTAGPAESVHAALGVSSREAARAAMAHGVPCPTCGAESHTEAKAADAPAPVVVTSDDSAAVSLIVETRWGVRMDDGDEIRWFAGEVEAWREFAEHVAADRELDNPNPEATP